jgi:hypothetical protein
MNTLLNHPLWKNSYSRIALILLLGLSVPLNILHLLIELLFPGLVGISAITCITLLAIALVLLAVAYFKDFRHMKQEEEA